MYLDINGSRLQTASFGGAGRTILAHGGFVGSWEIWQEPFERMSGGWRCVSYDHRGSGESQVDPPTITRMQMVRDLFSVMDAKGISRCVLAGESMGTVIALTAVLEQPERFAGLVLVAPVEPAAREYSERRNQFIAAIRADFPAAMKGFAARCVTEPNAEHVRRWLLDICLRSDAASSEQLLRMFDRDVETWELPLEQVQVPTLVIHGTDDIVSPNSIGKTIAERIPGATWCPIEGAGHVPTMTFSRRVAEAIEERFGSWDGRS